MAEVIRTYRHELTGRIQRLNERVAAGDPRLIEVEDGTKPLAYTPIPKEAVDEHRSKTKDAPAKADKDEEN